MPALLQKKVREGRKEMPDKVTSLSLGFLSVTPNGTLTVLGTSDCDRTPATCHVPYTRLGHTSSVPPTLLQSRDYNVLLAKENQGSEM